MDRELLRVMRDPASFRQEVSALPAGSWVVVDEVQKLPSLLDSFARFLEIAALANGQVTNVAGISRDAGIARMTVQGYFDVLVDTLVGTWLPAWRPRATVKETCR